MELIRIQRQSRIYRWLAAIMILIACAACGTVPGSNHHHQPVAVQGMLDLRQTDGDHAVSLDGEWGFYWNRLVDPEQVGQDRPADYVAVPNAWSKYQLQNGKPDRAGYATYTLHVHHAEPNKVWAIDMPTISSAYKLWVDGKLLIQNGKVSAQAGGTGVRMQQQVAVFQSADRTIDIVMQVSNSMHPRGGITRGIALGDPESILGAQQKRLAFELFLSGALFIMSVYHLGLYAMRRKEKAPLYFGVYCFVIALRSLIVGESFIYRIIPSLNWVLALKVEYLCLSIGALIFTMFVRAIYPQEMSSAIYRFIVVVCTAYSAIIILTGPYLFTSLLSYFQLMIIGFVSYAFIVFLLAVIRRREGSVISGIGGTILIACIINDILYYRGIIQTGDYVTMGLFSFIVAQSFILAIKFSKAFASSEELARKLRGLNNSLELKVQERTNELVEINELLRVQSSLDGLTGIANRRYFDQLLQEMLSDTVQSGGAMSLLLIDIDDFKSYNDTYGHLQGDECLKQVAAMLQSETKAWGGLAARYGGEEFAVIAPIGALEASKLADWLVRGTAALQIPHAASKTAPCITISCGVMTYAAVGVDEPVSANSLIEAADAALYKVKKQGRNGYFAAV
ncbi:sensor domain-containing diguanylate cyclase [Paenibacillus sp. MMS18-CY102]|uniref:sensor domain-containing diguanylate cyclase n=1 Tax=Paenibacillus sp. MMS18-CY102 TaxID=2682849 RepID=UPI00136595E2|nr:diguanylate cyclase [Paenibacillus sp. MMS18-CY102]MWC30251.1 diguanylate cyclase [Paenibacillus sp. MMS18-CY102]